jgi:hypothetical protein
MLRSYEKFTETLHLPPYHQEYSQLRSFNSSDGVILLSLCQEEKSYHELVCKTRQFLAKYDELMRFCSSCRIFFATRLSGMKRKRSDLCCSSSH